MIEDPFLTTDKFLRARQYDPKDFEKDSYKTIRLGSGVKAVIAKMLGDDQYTTQSIMFDKERFDKNNATAWIKRNLDRVQDAIELENQKTDLFEFEEDVSYEEHLQGHLPPLTNAQIARIMEVAGPAEQEDEDMEAQKIIDMRNNMSKYFREVQ